MNIDFSSTEFRRLLDLVYIGNWILNSTREPDDRIDEYDEILNKLFSQCGKYGMFALASKFRGEYLPSKAFEDGGIHEAISQYEDYVFFDILAEEMAHRDMAADGLDLDDFEEYSKRIDEYLQEFEANGIDNLVLEA